jgi:hypothetical protein
MQVGWKRGKWWVMGKFRNKYLFVSFEILQVGRDVWGDVYLCHCIQDFWVSTRGSATIHLALCLSESDFLWQSEACAEHPLLWRYVSYVVDVHVWRLGRDGVL